MRLALFLILAATAAQAQPVASAPPVESTRAGRAQRLGLAVASVGGGLAASASVIAVLRSDWDGPAGATLVSLAYPIGATLVVQAIGPLVGTDPQWATTTQDVLLGAVGGAVVGAVAGTVGAGVGFVVEYVVTGGDAYFLLGPAVGALAGGLVGVGTLLHLTTRRLQVAPAALTTPAGARTAGIRLTFGL